MMTLFHDQEYLASLPWKFERGPLILWCNPASAAQSLLESLGWTIRFNTDW